MDQMSLHLALKNLREVLNPPDDAGLLWLQSQIKAFQTQTFTMCCWSKELSLQVQFVFIYLQTSVCMAVEKITYVSHYFQIQQSFAHAQTCWCMRNEHDSAFVIALAQIHKKASRVIFIHRKWLKNQIISTKVSQ